MRIQGTETFGHTMTSANEITDITVPLKNREYGAMCTSFDGTNHCTLKAVDTLDWYFKSSKYIYMVNTDSIFTYSSSSTDDGILNPPLQSEGSAASILGSTTSIG